jgi:Tfp pilus assembly protein PilE
MPSYQSNVLKTRRAEAFGQLARIQAAYEVYYSQNNSYPTSNSLPGSTTTTTCNSMDTSIPSTANYCYTSVVIPTGYLLFARALPAQASDAEGSTSCSALSLFNENSMEEHGPAICWPS